MAIALRDARTYGVSQSAATAVRAVIPTCVAGDLLIVVWNCVGNGSGSGNSTSGASGWSVIREVTQTDNTYAVMLGKIATGTDVTNAGTTQQVGTLSDSGGTTQVGSASASYSGVDTSSTVTNAIIASNFTHSSAGSNPIGTGSATNTDANAWAVCGFTAASGSSGAVGTWSASGLTSRAVGGNGATLTTSAAILDSDGGVATGSRSYSGTWSRTPTRTNGFIALLKPQIDPTTGTMDTALSPVTASFAATREIPTGGIDSSISPVAAFVGVAAPPSGTIDTALSPVSASMTATATGGPMAMTLSPVSSAFEGAVNPIGDFAMTIPSIGSQFVAETKPFGEHVIRPEHESRAFRVTDDDTGLVYLKKRSQVTDL